MKTMCSISGCEKHSTRRGMCNKHYRRFMLHGNALFSKNRERGTGHLKDDGYISIKIHGKFHLEHVLKAEIALSKKLPHKAEVHHVDSNRSNNENKNLVICQDRTYHHLLHIRTKALIESGNANWRKCLVCKKYDDPKNLVFCNTGPIWHKECGQKYERERKRK